MFQVAEIRDKLEEVFEKTQARILASVIFSAYDELVKTRDFNELKEIVREIAKEQKEIAKAQKRTDIRMGELVKAQKETEVRVEELVKAQKETEVRVEELAKAQKETEVRVKELAKAQKETEIEIGKLTMGLDKLRIETGKLAKGLRETRGELGGLARSFGYAFENEAYRMLPKVLSDNYGIQIKEKLIRIEIGGKEINILGRAKRNGQDVLIVGEARLRLDERRKRIDVFKELEEKILAAREEYKEEAVRVLVTHYATKGFMKKAREKGIIVVQSFEW